MSRSKRILKSKDGKFKAHEQPAEGICPISQKKTGRQVRIILRSEHWEISWLVRERDENKQKDNELSDVTETIETEEQSKERRLSQLSLIKDIIVGNDSDETCERENSSSG